MLEKMTDIQLAEEVSRQYEMLIQIQNNLRTLSAEVAKRREAQALDVKSE